MDEVIIKEWEHAELKCQITKHLETGHYSGYVLLPEDHPFVDEYKDMNDYSDAHHRGITFAEWEVNKNKFYVGGFDCADGGDCVLGWTLEGVIEEVNRTAELLTIPSLVEMKLSR